MIVFEIPLPLPILLGAVAGMAAAIACNNTVRLPLPDPGRAKAVRAVWTLAWTAFAVLLANLNMLMGTAEVTSAITRNTVLYTAIGLLTVRYATVNLVWLPCVGLMLVSMMFGYDPAGPPGNYYWWAVVMSQSITSGQWIAVALLFVVASFAYVVPRSMSHILRLAED